MPTPSEKIISFDCICGDPNCTIPYGECHCGCGELTPIAKKNEKLHLRFKDKPVRFIPTHINRNRKVPIILDVCAFEYEGELCRQIPLTQGQFAIVWESDYEWLNQWNWFAQYVKSIKSFYARRNSPERTTIHMHRLILGMSSDDPRHGDHKNRNTLDNRRSNLRTASDPENTQNASLRSDNVSGVRGVTWNKEHQRWTARISCDRKRIFLGRFDDLSEARAAYESAALRFHKEFASFG